MIKLLAKVDSMSTSGMAMGRGSDSKEPASKLPGATQVSTTTAPPPPLPPSSLAVLRPTTTVFKSLYDIVPGHSFNTRTQHTHFLPPASPPHSLIRVRHKKPHTRS